MKKYRLLITVLCLLLVQIVLNSQNIAITMDDPHSNPTPLYTATKRDEQILYHLREHNTKAILFVQGSQVDNQCGRELVNRWNNAGHTIGNHTYTHCSLEEVDENFYKDDICKNHTLLKNYSNYKKIFRFPYLKEGDTTYKRDTIRKYLKDNEYSLGSVTIDMSDWYISDCLEQALIQDPHTNLTPYKEYYLDHACDRANYYDSLASKVVGRSPNHTLLVHHNLLNALFLGDLLKMFKDKGWDIVDATEAFSDAIFMLTPNTLPAGESLIWAMAKESGNYEDDLRYPGEDSSYEVEAMKYKNLLVNS